MLRPLRSLLPGRWILLAILLWACRDQTPTEPAASGTSAAATKRYTVRAEVVALPPRPGGELVLRHEAIPNFTDKSGAVVGMSSMVMPFPLAPDLSLAGIAPGDKIELVLSMDWSRGGYLIESLKKLPSETALNLEATQPAGSTGSGQQPMDTKKK